MNDSKRRDEVAGYLVVSEGGNCDGEAMLGQLHPTREAALAEAYNLAEEAWVGHERDDIELELGRHDGATIPELGWTWTVEEVRWA